MEARLIPLMSPVTEPEESAGYMSDHHYRVHLEEMQTAIYRVLPAVHHVERDETYIRSDYNLIIQDLIEEYTTAICWQRITHPKLVQLLLHHSPLPNTVVDLTLTWLEPELDLLDEAFQLHPFYRIK